MMDTTYQNCNSLDEFALALRDDKERSGNPDGEAGSEQEYPCAGLPSLDSIREAEQKKADLQRKAVFESSKRTIAGFKSMYDAFKGLNKEMQSALGVDYWKSIGSRFSNVDEVAFFAPVKYLKTSVEHGHKSFFDQETNETKYIPYVRSVNRYNSSFQRRDIFSFVYTMTRADSENPAKMSKMIQASIGLDELILDMVARLSLSGPMGAIMGCHDHIMGPIAKTGEFFMPTEKYDHSLSIGRRKPKPYPEYVPSTRVDYPELPDIDGIDLLIDGSDGELICRSTCGNQRVINELARRAFGIPSTSLPEAYTRAKRNLDALLAHNLSMLVYNAENPAQPGSVRLVYSNPATGKKARLAFATEALEGELAIFMSPAVGSLSEANSREMKLADIFENMFRGLYYNKLPEQA